MAFIADDTYEAGKKWAKGYAADLASVWDDIDFVGMNFKEFRKAMYAAPDFFTDEDFEHFIGDLGLWYIGADDDDLIDFFWGYVRDTALEFLFAKIGK